MCLRRTKMNEDSEWVFTHYSQTRHSQLVFSRV